MTMQERIAERHSNIEMLSEMLEASMGYDDRARICSQKKAEVQRLDREIAKERPKKFNPMWLFVVLGIITFGIGLIAMFIIDYLDKKKWAERTAKLREQRQEAAKAYDVACANLKNYDAEVFQPVIDKYVPEYFGRNYSRSSFAIAYMLDLLMNLRADTIREAINLYEECMYRMRMEKVMINTAEFTAMAAKNTARAAAAAEESARYAAATAASSAATAASSAATAANTGRIADSLEYNDTYNNY